MKKTLGRHIVLLFVLILVLAGSVFADELAYYQADEKGEYSIDCVGDAGNYYALLVVEGEYTQEDTPVISENTVQYIDQATADSNGNISFAEFVPKTNSPSTVYLGGGETGPVLLGYVNAEEPAKPVSIDVAQGDTLYLPDGSIITVEQAGPYNVEQDGIVVVNSGMDSQKIYVVDIEAATADLTAADAVVGSKSVAIKNETPHSDGNVYSGVRFTMTHNPDTRNVITEYGFIMTVESNKVINSNGAGKDYVLDKDMVDKGFAVKGAAWSAAEGGNGKVYNSDDPKKLIIAGVLHDIPLKKANVKTTLVSRPYAVYADGTYVYGEVTKCSLYEVCKLYESNNFEGCSEEDIKFIKKVIEIAEPKGIYIDISSLYPTN